MQTDLAIVQNEVQSLHRVISDVAAKIDVLLAMQVQLGRMQAEQEHDRQGLTRAFESIRGVRKQAEGTDGRLNASLAFIKGGAFVGAILFGFLQWYALQQIEAIRDVTVTSTSFDRRMNAIEAKLWPDK